MLSTYPHNHSLSVAAGQNTTLLLAKPNAKLSELPRHPIDVNAPSACVKCHKESEDDDSPLECEKVKKNVCIYIPIILNLL
jgi:hypothetical protein